MGVAAALALGCEAQVIPSYQGEPLASLQGRVEAVADVQGAEVGVLWLTSGPGDECSGPTTTDCMATGSMSADNTDWDCVAACGDMPDCTDLEAMQTWAACQESCGSESQVEFDLNLGMCYSGAVTQSVSVQGDFPARFKLDLLVPPPDEALLTADTGERAAIGFILALEPGTGAVSLSMDTEPPDWLIGASEMNLLAYAADPISADSAWGRYLGGSYEVGYHVLSVVPMVRCGFPEAIETGGPGPDSEGGEDSAPVPVATDAGVASDAASATPTDAGEVTIWPPEDLTGVPWMCGNGVCEEGETCDRCSDCGCDNGEEDPVSTGITNLDPGYSCLAKPNAFRPADDGLDTEIQLKIAPLESLMMPEI
jgi:hypothetical protein